MATPYLEIQGLTKRIGHRVLFENISLTINEREHIGLIAKNGTGKSTLLSIIAGKESDDGGKIILRKDLKVGYLEQTPTITPAQLKDKSEEYLQLYKQHLTQMNITEEEADRPASQLSGGQIKRIALARVLASQPELLILDEPTNHLDAESIDWLEQHLHQYAGTVICITHDRYFLDNVAGWILELDRGEGIPWKGNYSSWLEQKTARMSME